MTIPNHCKHKQSKGMTGRQQQHALAVKQTRHSLTWFRKIFKIIKAIIKATVKAIREALSLQNRQIEQRQPRCWCNKIKSCKVVVAIQLIRRQQQQQHKLSRFHYSWVVRKVRNRLCFQLRWNLEKAFKRLQASRWTRIYLWDFHPSQPQLHLQLLRRSSAKEVWNQKLSKT